MKTQKYRCRKCGEIFIIAEVPQNPQLTCPRCQSTDWEEHNSCSLEIGPPPWDYLCQQCGIRFQVTAPRGPDEANSIRCPVCQSQNIKWLAQTYAAPVSGG